METTLEKEQTAPEDSRNEKQKARAGVDNEEYGRILDYQTTSKATP